MDPIVAVRDERQKVDTKKIPLEFRGNGTEYFKIWIVNILLTILTLGIYSAWATVRNNRYLHSNLYLGEDNFRYLAEPLMILKGRLIAVAAFILFMYVYQAAPLVGIGLSVILFFLIPYFVNKSMEFNRRMSAYRNVQFRFKASYGEAFMVLYVWPTIGILTFGLLYPLALLRLNQYLVRNSAYGVTRFSFDATFKEYAQIFLIILGSLLVLGLLAGGLTLLVPSYLAFLIILGVVVACFGLGVFFVVATTNLFYQSLALLDHRFEARITLMGLAKVVLINTLLIVLTLGLYLPAAKVRMAKYISSCLVMKPAGSLDDFIAAEKKNTSALGEELGQIFDFSV